MPSPWVVRALRRTLDPLLLNRSVYRLVRFYRSVYDGEGDPEITRNGELRVLKSVLPKCKTIFDVGANVGNWTAHALSAAPQDAQIHCFEPCAGNFAQLTARNYPSRVSAFHYGLSDTAGELTLNTYGDGAGLNSLYRWTELDVVGLSSVPEQIQLSTLDEHCAEHDVSRIDFMKIDVEGHERSVLQGASHMLGKGAIRMIQFEYGPVCIDARVFLADIIELLKPCGFRVYKIRRNKLDLLAKYHTSVETFGLSNWLAVHESVPDSDLPIN